VSAAADFEAHRTACQACQAAKADGELCFIGRRLLEVAAPSQTALVPATQNMVPGEMAREVALQLAKVFARTPGGASVPIPLEKTTGGGVEVRTHRDAVMHVPVRDINVYNEIRQAIPMLARLAESINSFMIVDEEARSIIKRCRSLAVDLQGEIERRLGG
jgi:hypothetical protein